MRIKLSFLYNIFTIICQTVFYTLYDTHHLSFFVKNPSYAIEKYILIDIQVTYKLELVLFLPTVKAW